MSTLPEGASFVVVGGGVHGLSTAYHLAEEGADVVLLERRRLGAGASGVSGGIVRNYYLSAAMNELVRRSVDVFDLDPGGFGFRRVGYVAAVGEEQAEDLERIAEQHAAVGYASTLVRGEAACRAHMQGLFPDWRPRGVTAVLHEHGSGWADPGATLANLAGMARSQGVRVFEETEVLGFDLADGCVRTVETAAGSIECGAVLVAPGPWARDLWRLLELPDEVAVGEERRPMFSYMQVREGDFVLPSGDHLPERAPVVHLDLYEPLRSDRDGRELHPGPWGIYFRSGLREGVQGGGLPLPLDPECELDPYGPSHPEHGVAGGDFDEFFTSGLAAALERFRGRSHEWRCSSYGAQGCFTPDNYPVAGFVRPNAYVILDSIHGFKVLALGELAAQELRGVPVPELAPFRFERFAAAATHPVSAGPYPWT